MKKFISMVMAAAMVISLVPATAFAIEGDVVGAAKIMKAATMTKAEAASPITGDVPELQVDITDVSWKHTTSAESTIALEVKLDNAKFHTLDGLTGTALDNAFADMITLVCECGTTRSVATGAPIYGAIDVTKVNADLNRVEFTLTHYTYDSDTSAWVETPYGEDDAISFDLVTTMTKTKVGTEAKVTIESNDVTINNGEDLVFAKVAEKGIAVELDEDVVDVAVEEIATAETVVVESTVSNLSDVLRFVYDNAGATGTTCAKIELELKGGFEFANSAAVPVSVDGSPLANATGDWSKAVYADDEINLYLDSRFVAGTGDEVEITGLEIEATTAKAGDEAVIVVKTPDCDSVKVTVAKVIANAVTMSVDADEDVPVFYSGVNTANYGLTDDADHYALEVTVKESFAGAWDMDKKFELSLPEGVYVTDVIATDENGTMGAGRTALTALTDVFAEAYQAGDHKSFEFGKRVFFELDPRADKGENHEMTFTLQLVADPGFVGDVVLTLEGAALETQEVTIAKFVSPMIIKAEQNDVIIDYRYTEIPTEIVITEAEAGLWADTLAMGFDVEDNGSTLISFEDDAVITVNEESDMEIDDTPTGFTNQIAFGVDEESDDEVAVVTISGIELFMQRNIPAGAYDLEMTNNTAVQRYNAQPLFAPDCQTTDLACSCTPSTAAATQGECTVVTHDECFVADVADYSTVVKEGWINVVTAGRDQDDASFTTKIVVPVGETTMYAGEKAITLDVPAYINANGYTMLPVRAVATALGINNDAVQWDQATKTVIIMYGQRIITMTAGQSVVYVSGTAIPAKAAVEIVDSRAFLGLRDLATTLGISAVSYDDATKTATLN